MSEPWLMPAFAGAPILPLLLVVWLGLFPRSRLIFLAPWLALPALMLLAFPSGTMVDYRWLWLGLSLGLDETNRSFLMLTSVLWLASGFYARAYLRDDPNYLRYVVCHLLCMAGNFGLVLSQEVISFYAGFALMSLAAFGLVVHTGTRRAWRAGLVYLIMAVAGELMLFAGIVLMVSASGSVRLVDLQGLVPGFATVFLLVIGLGVKAGLLGLHFWLPLAHPVAPTPASAVLSGVMVKAGLLGWLRFLPLGEVALPHWGGVLLGLGLAGAFYGVFRGLPETDAKTILAFSSISQMGLMTSVVGVGLLAPGAWPALSASLMLYALHHALSKGALFLGVGVCATTVGTGRWASVARVAMVVLAGSLAGLPLTSGATAKIALKKTLAAIDPLHASLLTGLLSLAAVATTLLMLRFLSQLRFAADGQGGSPVGLWLPWAALLLLAPVVALLHPGADGVFDGGAQWAALWPIGLGLVLWWFGWRPRVLHFFERFTFALRRRMQRLGSGDRKVAIGIRDRVANPLAQWSDYPPRLPDFRSWLSGSAARAERLTMSWPVFGLLFLVLLWLLLVAASSGIR